MQYISTSALAKELEIKSNELFNKLEKSGLIEKKESQWMLTKLGEERGGKTKESPKFGKYIVWPSGSFYLKENNSSSISKPTLSSTKIAKNFDVSSQKMNHILAELGWIKKELSGWSVTKQGERLGGVQLEHFRSGSPYVLWPDEILKNKNLNAVFNDELETKNQNENIGITDSSTKNFREVFPAKHRATDGHFVRSRAEMLIDNALYISGIAHAYERKLPIEEDVYSDFFIPSQNVYIEYWGLENDPKYAERKKKKLEIYKKYDFNLIELTDEDILNLDDNLPRKLLKYNIKVY